MGHLPVRSFSVPLFSLQLLFIQSQVFLLEPEYKGHLFAACKNICTYWIQLLCMSVHLCLFTPALTTILSFLSTCISCALFFLFSTPPFKHLYGSITLYIENITSFKSKIESMLIDIISCFLHVLKAVPWSFREYESYHGHVLIPTSAISIALKC